MTRCAKENDQEENPIQTKFSSSRTIKAVAFQLATEKGKTVTISTADSVILVNTLNKWLFPYFSKTAIRRGICSDCYNVIKVPITNIVRQTPNNTL